MHMVVQEPKQNPPHIPPGLRLRYSLFTLFLITTVAGCCIGCPVAFMRWWSSESTIATFRGAHQRSVTIATPTFLDSPGQPITVRFYDGLRQIELCGTAVDPERNPKAKDFNVIWLENGDVAVAFSTLVQESGYWQPIATYRYSTNQLFDEDDRLPFELARAASAQFAKEHPGVGPIKVLRIEPSKLKE
jgi:hypothetical protein